QARRVFPIFDERHVGRRGIGDSRLVQRTAGESNGLEAIAGADIDSVETFGRALAGIEVLPVLPRGEPKEVRRGRGIAGSARGSPGGPRHRDGNGSQRLASGVRAADVDDVVSRGESIIGEAPRRKITTVGRKRGRLSIYGNRLCLVRGSVNLELCGLG